MTIFPRPNWRREGCECLSDSGNVLTVDKRVPLTDAQISATLFGIKGGPVMLGDDIDRINEERLDLIRKVFPRLPECTRATSSCAPRRAWPWRTRWDYDGSPRTARTNRC